MSDWTRGMTDWSRRRMPLRCDMCAERREDVLHFGLVRRNVPTPSGRKTTLGAGGISLCRQCWEGLDHVRGRRVA